MSGNSEDNHGWLGRDAGHLYFNQLLKYKNLNVIKISHQLKKKVTLLLKKIKPFLFVYLFLYIKEIQKTTPQTMLIMAIQFCQPPLLGLLPQIHRE